MTDQPTPHRDRPVTSTDGAASPSPVPMINYALYLVALFTGFPFLIAGIIAFVLRSDAPAWARSHYDHQIRIFLVVLIGGAIFSALFMISMPLMMVLIGFLILPFAVLGLAYLWIWTLVRCIRGIRTANDGLAYDGPTGWRP